MVFIEMGDKWRLKLWMLFGQHWMLEIFLMSRMYNS